MSIILVSMLSMVTASVHPIEKTGCSTEYPSISVRFKAIAPAPPNSGIGLSLDHSIIPRHKKPVIPRFEVKPERHHPAIDPGIHIPVEKLVDPKISIPLPHNVDPGMTIPLKGHLKTQKNLKYHYC